MILLFVKISSIKVAPLAVLNTLNFRKEPSATGERHHIGAEFSNQWSMAFGLQVDTL